MFKHLFKGLLAGIMLKLVANYRRLSLHLLKIEAAKAYLHGVQMARLSALGLMGLGLTVGLICVGVVLFHVGLFILLPWHVAAKAVFGMILGLVYVVIGVVVLRTAMAEKTWMEKSGAAQMVAEAINQSKKD